MATARLALPRPHRRGVRRLLAAALGVTAVVAVLVPSAVTSASAAPDLAAPRLAVPTVSAPDLSLHQVQAQIAALDHKAEVVAESFDAATSELASLRRQQRSTMRHLAHDQAVLSSTRGKVAAAAAAAYRSGSELGPAIAFVSTGNAQTAIDQSASLDQIAAYQTRQVAAADAAQRAVNAEQAVDRAEVAAQRGALQAITAQRNRIHSLLQQRQAALSGLKAAARRQLAAQHRQQIVRQVSQRQAYNGPATGSAAAAVRFAYAQLGKPYVYGAAGPSSYDCSGLTMQAWAAAGVALPHNAAAQQAAIAPVSMSSLQPGDLVFFGSPAYHEAIYVGGGRIIQAPHTGASVEITPLGSPTSAGRP